MIEGTDALKPPLLVELAVVGQVRLGNQGEDLPLLHRYGAVEELARRPEGHSEDGQDLQVLGGLQDGPQALHGPLQQGVLEKEVPAGVAGEAQLRQD